VIGFMVNKSEERIAMDSIDDIFKYADRIKESIAEYV